MKIGMNKVYFVIDYSKDTLDLTYCGSNIDNANQVIESRINSLKDNPGFNLERKYDYNSSRIVVLNKCNEHNVAIIKSIEIIFNNISEDDENPAIIEVYIKDSPYNYKVFVINNNIYYSTGFGTYYCIGTMDNNINTLSDFIRKVLCGVCRLPNKKYIANTPIKLIEG